MSKRVICIITTVALFFLTACGSSTPSATHSAEASASAAASESEAVSNTADGFDLIGGKWVIGAFYKDGERYDLTDPKYTAFLDLYDSQSLEVREDGTFLYRNNMFYTEGHYAKQEENSEKTSFYLTQESGYMLRIEDGETVKKESTGRSDYLIEVSKTNGEVTFIGIDSDTGEPDQNDTLFVLVKSEDGGSVQTEFSDEFESVQMGSVTCQIPADWVCVSQEDDGKKMIWQYTTSEDERQQQMIGIIIGTLEGNSFNTKAAAQYMLEKAFTDTYNEENGYRDILCETYTGCTNPAIHGKSTSNKGTVNESYYVMASSGKELIMISYNRASGAVGDYSSLFTKVVNSMEFPAFDDEAGSAPSVPTKPDTASAEQNSAATEKPTPSASATSGERNALDKAGDYLRYSAFSYSGLVEQLEYEGYSHAEATYAADHCGADWKEQALKKAQSYLDYSAFSYKGLVEQLEYEGFTSSEASYGADNCGADWNEQAVKKAKQYLEYSSFSKSSLIDQLEYEGFTSSQASYGASQAY